MDYSEYVFSPRERLLFTVEALGIVCVVAILFYRSLIPMAAAVVFVPFFLKRSAAKCCEKRKQELTMQFREAMQSVSGALVAGYSMENAWREAERDMRILYGDEGCMTRELHNMNQAIMLHENLEDLIDDFGKRSDLKDVKSFCQVMRFAKRSGGDFTKIIENTIKKIGDKIDITREIYTTMTAKRLESKLMSVIPLGVLMYVSLSFGGYLDVLYHNAQGVIIMTVCLIVYGMGILLSEKIMRGVRL